MPPSTASTMASPCLLRRFRCNRRGSAALEFALVAPVFFALLFAIIETGIMFLAGQLLETINQDSARMILTGQAQSASYSQSQFASYVCNQVPALFNCSNIYIDVENYPSFSNIDITNPISSSCNVDTSNFKYSPGGPGDIVVVRLFYQWPLYVTPFGCGNKVLLSSTAAFKNEPY